MTPLTTWCDAVEATTADERATLADLAELLADGYSAGRTAVVATVGIHTGLAIQAETEAEARAWAEWLERSTDMDRMALGVERDGANNLNGCWSGTWRLCPVQVRWLERTPAVAA